MSTKGKWKINTEIPEPWEVTLEGLTFSLKLLPSKHIGVFPEQSVGWEWLEERITNNELRMTNKNAEVKVLNLFGYTGGASLACAKAGASVCHVDSSEWAVDKAKENAKLSELGDAPIRFIVDDVRKFVERDIKRGNKYDVILLDPPVYGKGVKDEVWNIDEDLLPLLTRIKTLLSSDPLAIVLNGYASGYSHLTYARLLELTLYDISGSVTSDELAIRESSSGKLLPSGIFARWSK